MLVAPLTAQLCRSLQAQAAAQKRLALYPHLSGAHRLYLCFALGHRLVSGTDTRWTLARYQGPLERSFADPRISRLHRHQQETLAWLTGTALAHDTPRELLAVAWTLARAAWRPSEWEPWMGDRPVAVSRPASIGALPESDEDSFDGQPEWVEEARPRVAGGDGEWVAIRQVLDGLDTWQDAVQEHFGLPLGDMALLGQPDWERLTSRCNVLLWSADVPQALPEVPLELWQQLRAA